MVSSYIPMMEISCEGIRGIFVVGWLDCFVFDRVIIGVPRYAMQPVSKKRAQPGL